MICRLPKTSVSHVLATDLIKSEKSACKSWIYQICELCEQYGLPDPGHLLQVPLAKEAFKKLTKQRVTDYWEQLLRAEAEDHRYSSLTYFKPRFLSLSVPHPIWTTAGSSQGRDAMATIHVQMFSGRYRSASVCEHWSKNRGGLCLLSPSHLSNLLWFGSRQGQACQIHCWLLQKFPSYPWSDNFLLHSIYTSLLAVLFGLFSYPWSYCC